MGTKFNSVSENIVANQEFRISEIEKQKYKWE